jgi:hypothetical protein
VIILDTNVVSEIMRNRPDSRVFTWLEGCDPASLFTTTITEAEILVGVARLATGLRKRNMLREAEEVFRTDLAGRVLAFDRSAAAAYAEIAARRERMGNRIEFADGQIAAITLVQGARLATQNIRHFQYCGVDIIDPWTV